MYETYDPDLAVIEAQDDHKVLTLVEYEGREFLTTGMHFVNRIGYYITKEPWTKDADYCIDGHGEMPCNCGYYDMVAAERSDEENQ
jgi:hypothetical protein